MNRSVIRMCNVSKRYASQHALRDVSFEVPRGSVFALLGENGAGKTTAIRILLGLVEPDAGHAEVLGIRCAEDGIGVRRRVGYLAERPALYDWMTVSEIGWFTAGFYPDGFLARYHELIRQFELPPTRQIKALSKGMRAKVALSLAMANAPDVLILDEPTSGLDTMVRREFLESMVTLAEAGQTVLLSSHQIGEVERVADIVAIIHEGSLRIVEPLEELKERTRELTVTLVDGIAPPPPIAGNILSQSRRGRQWQVMVRDFDRRHEDLLRDAPGVAHLEVRVPSLEDIFLAYMRGNNGGQPQQPVAEAVAR